MEYLKRTWCEIHLDHLYYNIKQLQETAQKKLMGIVKADAYGHGDVYTAKVLQQAGIDFFGVSNVNEALNLRQAGIQGEILVLGYTPVEMVQTLISNQITQTVHCTEYAKLLNLQISGSQTLKVHLKIDTGMNRIGFVQNQTADSTDEILALKGLQGLTICGIFTHFPCADSFDLQDAAFTQQQITYFNQLIERLNANHLYFEAIHTQNSAGIINYANSVCNYARAGIAMYGLNPSSDIKTDLKLKPVLSLKTVVTMVKQVPQGVDIGYGRTYHTSRPMKIATLPIGYADGYYRSFSNRADILLHGTRCKVVGRVCMDQLMIDVTHLEQVQLGDIATVIGMDGKECITADELAQLADTIHYEVVCSISKRVPRVYYQHGIEIGFLDHS